MARPFASRLGSKSSGGITLASEYGGEVISGLGCCTLGGDSYDGAGFIRGNLNGLSPITLLSPHLFPALAFGLCPLRGP